MSVFLDLLCGLLPLHSVLQVEGNELRRVLDRSIGEYFDNVPDIKEELFLSSASGSWLDCFGRDFGVPRRINEDDESYRERIVFEKLEYLTVGNVMEFYGLTLYAFVSLYNPLVNQLTSDNPYISDRYMSIADETTQEILDKKFMLDNRVLWLDELTGENYNSIIDVNGQEVLYKYIGILNKFDVREFFL
jgi:hypothetical protein